MPLFVWALFVAFLQFCLLCIPLLVRVLRVVSGRAAWCARGRRPAREPSAPRASLGASSRSPARPRHRPRAPQPGPPAPPAPSTPVGPGRCSAARRVVSKPGQALQATRQPPIGRSVVATPALPPPTGTAASAKAPRSRLARNQCRLCRCSLTPVCNRWHHRQQQAAIIGAFSADRGATGYMYPLQSPNRGATGFIRR